MSETKKRGESRGRAFTTDAAAKHQEVAAPPAPEFPAVVPDYGDDAGLGMEGVSQSEMLIPFMRIIARTSAVVTEGNVAYDEHVRPGMIYNTSTGDYYKRDIGFGFIPCARDSSYVERVPFNDGGGFRGTWAHDDPRIAPLLKEQGGFRALKTNAGTELVETYTVFGVVVPRHPESGAWLDEQAMPGVVSFSSTQMKKYRSLITRLQAMIGRPPKFPMFAWRWNFTVVPEKNKSGDYFGWHISLAADVANDARLAPTSPLYLLAREVNSLIKSGAAKADFEQSDAATEDDGPRGGGGPTIDQTGDVESEIPF